jgi:hypothetical protein
MALCITRKKRMLLRNGLLDVLIDGQVIGQLANGETKVFNVNQGIHIVNVKMGWLKSANKSISTCPEKILPLVADMARGGLLFYIAPVLGFKINQFFVLSDEKEMSQKGIPYVFEIISEKNCK